MLKSHPCGAVHTKTSCNNVILQKLHILCKTPLLLFSTFSMMGYSRVTFNLSLITHVCVYVLTPPAYNRLSSPRFPTWPDDCVRLTAPDGPPHLLDGDQHKQNISLQTNGLIALMMEDLWETHNKQPLINKIHFIPFLLQLSLWLLLEMWCAATKKKILI